MDFVLSQRFRDRNRSIVPLPMSDLKSLRVWWLPKNYHYPSNIPGCRKSIQGHRGQSWTSWISLLTLCRPWRRNHEDILLEESTSDVVALTRNDEEKIITSVLDSVGVKRILPKSIIHWDHCGYDDIKRIAVDTIMHRVQGATMYSFKLVALHHVATADWKPCIKFIANLISSLWIGIEEGRLTAAIIRDGKAISWGWLFNGRGSDYRDQFWSAKY